MKPTWFTYWRALPLCLAALLNGCGGGAGGPNSSGNDIGARFLQTALTIERDVDDRRGIPSQTLSLQVVNPPGEGYFYRYTYTSQGIELVGDIARATDAGIDFQVHLKTPFTLPLGTYDDLLRVELCMDKACTRQAVGSPFVASVRYALGYFAPVEPDIAALNAATRITLPHDLVDAAYSAALDAVVTVSNRPAAALNVYLLATGESHSVPLFKAPTAVSLTPKGLHAAVGHDAAISVLKLASAAAAQPMTAAPFATALAVVHWPSTTETASMFSATRLSIPTTCVCWTRPPAPTC